MGAPAVPLRKCATPRCYRHVHGGAKSGHCRACANELVYNSRVMLGRHVGAIAGAIIARSLSCRSTG